MAEGLDVRHAARIALRDFGISRARLTRVASRHNDVFRINVPDMGIFALRLQNQRLTDAQAHSQVKWIESLAAASDVTVPRPMRTTDGRPFTYVECAGKPRRAVLLEWLPGRTASTRSDAVYRSAVEMIARLHRHSETFRLGAGFAARKLDDQWLFGPQFFVHASAARQYLNASKRKTIRMAEKLVRQSMQKLGKDKSRFGLIHADLNLGNILFHHGQASPIDFDEFGRGWYLFDLAELIRTSVTPDNWRERKQLVLDLYQQTRALDGVEAEAMDGFIIAVFVQYLNWAFLHARNKQDLKWVGFCLEVIRAVAGR